MGLVERAKKICLDPKNTWPVIAGETTPTGALITGYVLPLAAIGAVAGLIGGSLVGHTLPFVGTYRVPIVSGLVLAVYQLGMAVVSVFVMSFIINALAPTFGGQKDQAQALKLAAYAYTPAWVAGVLTIIPALGLLVLFAALYGLYLLYLGLPRLMKNPEDKSAGYTALVVVAAIVVSVVIGAVGGLIARPAMRGLQGAGVSGASFDKDSPVGRFQAMGQVAEEMGKRMEAAEKSGNKDEQMKAAMEGLGTMIGGGKRFEPLAVDRLKAFLPERLAGLPRSGGSAERGGAMGLKTANARASYGQGDGRSVDLEITDTGGAAGLLGLASWAGVESEKEDASGTERTRKEGSRLVHERSSKGDGASEYAVVLGSRFVVKASGHGVGLDALKGAVASLDLDQLEALKESGAQK